MWYAWLLVAVLQVIISAINGAAVGRTATRLQSERCVRNWSYTNMYGEGAGCALALMADISIASQRVKCSLAIPSPSASPISTPKTNCFLASMWALCKGKVRRWSHPTWRSRRRSCCVSVAVTVRNGES